MQVIDDFLTPSYHYEILQFVEGSEMQWFYSPDITTEGNVSKQLGLHGFSNHFYDIMRETPPSPFQSLMMPFLFQVKDFVKSPRVLRARLDMTLYNPFCLPDACAHTPHVDMDGEHHTAVYYVNDSDGDTIIGDEKVSDVTKHPSLKRAAKTVAELYDLKHSKQYKDELTYNENGEIFSAWFLQAKNKNDLRKRSKAHKIIADHTSGMMGRSMDHVASFVTGMSTSTGIFDNDKYQFSENLLNYYEYMKKNNVNLILCPTAIGFCKIKNKNICLRGEREKWLNVITANSLMINTPVVICNRIGTETDKDHSISFWGSSFITKDIIILTEKSGKIKLIDLQNNKISHIEHNLKILEDGQGGLLDILYKDNFIYVSYSENRGEGKTSTSIAKGKFDNKKIIFNNLFRAEPPIKSGYHFGSRLAIKENMLFASDGERGAGMIAQDPTKHPGSIIRINIDGSVPKDNPHFINKKKWLPEIYQIGIRNPQGLVISPFDDKVYISNHGARGGDWFGEVKIGENYGWKILGWGGTNYTGTEIGPKWKPGFTKAIKYWVPVSYTHLTLPTSDLV